MATEIKRQGRIRRTNLRGLPVYYLADDLGLVWLGGWWDLATARNRLQQAESCDWVPEQMDCSVDVALGEGGEESKS